MGQEKIPLEQQVHLRLFSVYLANAVNKKKTGAAPMKISFPSYSPCTPRSS